MDYGSGNKNTEVVRRSSSKVPMVLNSSETYLMTTTTTTATTLDPDKDEYDTTNNGRRRFTTKRILVALLFVAFIGFVIADSLTNNNIKDGMENFLQWVEENPTAGVFAFVGVYFAATVLFVPGSILTLGSGFVFANAFGLGKGVLLATVAVFVGASTGAVASFLLGRYLLRDWIEATLSQRYKVLGAIDATLQKQGLRIMILLRLSPIIPFNAFNYLSGVTAVRLLHYSWALLAMLPGTLLYVFVGASAGSLTDSGGRASENRTVTIVTIVVGVVFGVLAIGVTSYYAKKELNAAIGTEDEEENEGRSGDPLYVDA